MNTNRPHVLILSRRCPHCAEAMKLVKNNNVKVVWIEDSSIKLPPYVTCVPYLVTNTGERYVEDDLFFFLERLQFVVPPPGSRSVPSTAARPTQAPAQTQAQTSTDPQPFLGTGMEAAFSDSFSFLDDKETLYRHQEIVGSEQNVMAPAAVQDEGRPRKTDDSLLDKYVRSREEDLQRIMPPQQQRS